MNSLKSITLWVLIFFLCILLGMKIRDKDRPVELTISEFLSIAAAHVDKTTGLNTAFDGPLLDKGGRIEGKLAKNVTIPGSTARQGQSFTAEYHPLASPLVLDKMVQYGVTRYDATPESQLLTQMLPSLILLIGLFVVLWFVFVRQIQSSGNKAMSFGKSKAKLITEGAVKVTFDDVAGVEEAKEELREVVEFLKDPKKFSRLGGKIPKGVLLYGPPGTGKTLLAKAVAGEASVPFFSISGSDFVEMFVGVGASRVRDLFEQAKKSKPCLIFIDEIDAVGRHRFAGIGGGHDEREQTLNQLLVEMDGFATNEGVILVAATNRPDVLDPALLRPGRFDRQITVDYPDVIGREKILKVHAKGVKLATTVELESIAKGTPGFSGADLANIINEAALLAARCNKASIEQIDLEEAKDRVMMGPERRSLRIIDEEKRETAVHEAGHALAGHFTPGCDPIHKITIIPRGRSLGLTASLPREEKHATSRTQLKAALVYALGGMAAEKIVLSDSGTGVGNDLMRVTNMARRMVCEFGMSDKLGPRTFGEANSQVFLGKDMGTDRRDYSEESAEMIDQEIKAIVDEAFSRALGIMNDHRDALDRVTQALIERETLTAEEFRQVVEGKPLEPLFRKNNDDVPKQPSNDQAEKDRRKARAPRLGDILEGPRQVPG